MKRIVLLAVLLIQSIGLSGCWSSTPIENLNMEVAVALDIADETPIEEDFEQRGGGTRRIDECPAPTNLSYPKVQWVQKRKVHPPEISII